MRIGLVAEGTTDFLVLESALARIAPGATFRRLWPDTQMGGRPYGWRGVQRWCEEHGAALDAFMRGVVGDELDMLVVHVDCSMAHNVDARRPCPPASDTAAALQVVTASWLALEPLPAWLVVATPAQTSDAWAVAALDPPYESAVLECEQGIERELVRRKLLRIRGGSKSTAQYRPLAVAIGERWERVRETCGQAAAFDAGARRAAMLVAAGFWTS